MHRRQFIKYFVVGGSMASMGGGYLWLNADRDQSDLRLSTFLPELQQLSAGVFEKSGDWNPFQVFSHCAQSVEYSMTGFPQRKSALFQQTAGRLAFSVFSARGAMSHDLAEPIPGAPVLDTVGEAFLALNRLTTALRKFEAFDQPLQPHFAFGTLSKSDYELAHVLHIKNHLQEFNNIPLSLQISG